MVDQPYPTYHAGYFRKIRKCKPMWMDVAWEGRKIWGTPCVVWIYLRESPQSRHVDKQTMSQRLVASCNQRPWNVWRWVFRIGDKTPHYAQACDGGVLSVGCCCSGDAPGTLEIKYKFDRILGENCFTGERQGCWTSKTETKQIIWNTEKIGVWRTLEKYWGLAQSL